MLRAALFALVGVLFLVHWVLADPGYEVSRSQGDWTRVLEFSAAILALALAIVMFARLVGGRVVSRVSRVAASGAALSSLANVLEDGLQMDWAFFGFVLGSAIADLGLLMLAVVIAFAGRGTHRLLSLIPAATFAAIVFYVIAGGILMLVAWLGAAVVALALPERPAPTTP